MHKLTLLSSILMAILLTLGCKSAKNVAIPTSVETTVELPPRSSRLTMEQARHWGHLDLMTDTIAGISLAKAYELLKGKQSSTVVVAVADTGIDIDHEDLASMIWTNPKEVAGDGKDNDSNGFVDDMHGWNFLGDTYKENLEMTRMVRLFKKEFGDKTAADITPERMEDFRLYKKLEKEVKERFAGSGSYYNLDFNARENMPDPYDFSIQVYGNNNVNNGGRNESHASHVAGIIGAARNNGKGMNGVADNVKIMSLRVVPEGDEYDKDVALAIRYAADNGAKILNASFGKGYSPKREWVYEAIQYAAEKDMLIVMSSGNNGQNVDIEPTFPNDSPDGVTEIADNVLIVGASTPSYDESLAAAFSNYGKKHVDIFAPGVRIYSTVPEGVYRAMNGTSMATPAVAGVAALLRSYYPKLTASQVKKIILRSGTKINFKVMMPGSEPTLVPFTDLCASGRILNAYEAVKMAEGMKF
ncbi:MAG: S8 family peptidase [Bacteroidota bacterium]